MKNSKVIIFNDQAGNIEVTYLSDYQPSDSIIPDGSIWIETSKQPYRFYRYDAKIKQWTLVQDLSSNVYLGEDPPSDPYDGLLWIQSSTLQLQVYIDNAWQPISGGSSSSGTGLYTGDNKTIQVKDGVISVLFNNDETKDPGYVWDNKRIQKEALVKALIFG